MLDWSWSVFKGVDEEPVAIEQWLSAGPMGDDGGHASAGGAALSKVLPVSYDTTP